jgi:hypothetical protein
VHAASFWRDSRRPKTGRGIAQASLTAALLEIGLDGGEQIYESSEGDKRELLQYFTTLRLRALTVQ